MKRFLIVAFVFLSAVSAPSPATANPYRLAMRKARVDLRAYARTMRLNFPGPLGVFFGDDGGDAAKEADGTAGDSPVAKRDVQPDADLDRAITGIETLAKKYDPTYVYTPTTPVAPGPGGELLESEVDTPVVLGDDVK